MGLGERLEGRATSDHVVDERHEFVANGLALEPRSDTRRPYVWRVSARGELDAMSSDQLNDVVALTIDQGARAVVLDLTDVVFIDSSGLRSILKAQADLEAVGGGLSCVGLSPAAERLLDVTGLLDRLRNGQFERDEPTT